MTLDIRITPVRHIVDEGAWLCAIDGNDGVEVLVGDAPEGPSAIALEQARRIYTRREMLAEQARQYINSFVPASSFEYAPDAPAAPAPVPRSLTQLPIEFPQE